MHCKLTANVIRLRFALLATAATPCAACGAEPNRCPPQPGYVCTLAGTGELGFNRDGLSPTDSDLFLVSAARRGPDRQLYLMDFNNQRLRRVDEQGKVETVIGNGFHALAAEGYAVTESPLENPIDFDFMSDGRLVFVSYHDPRVLVWDDDDTLRSLAGTTEVGLDGDEGDDGPADQAMFIQLDGIAIDEQDRIYVSDSLAHRVRVVHDGTVETVAGTGVAGYSGDGGPGTEAKLHWPTALTFDASGALLIADSRNHVIRRLDGDGTITTLAGTGEPGSAGDEGAATDAQFNQPNGLAVGEDGSIYVGDRANFRVRQIDPDNIVHTLAGTGRQSDPEHLPTGPVSASNVDLGYLARLALDGDTLLIADQSTSIVRELRLR